MTNKTLTLFAITPLFMAVCSGIFSFDTENLTLFLGLWMIVAIPWALVRLYKTPDTN